MNDDLQNIYNMQLHQTIAAEDSWRMKRVPGGWLYWRTIAFVNDSPVPIFVPYSKEFIADFKNVNKHERD